MNATIDGARKMKKTVKFFRDHLIAFGTVPSDAGVIAPTGSKNNKCHHSWWPKMGIQRHEFFKISA